MDLPSVDAVDVADLTDAPGRPAARVTGGPADSITSAWRQLSAAPGKTPESHAPRWGLRFYRNGALLAEASICWTSGTIRSKGKVFSFDRMSEQSRQLRSALRDARMRDTLFANLDEASEAAATEFARSPELWRRSEGCPHCAADTIQLLHGVDADGGLWKSHLCACRGWQCTRCFAVLDQQHDCCR